MLLPASFCKAKLTEEEKTYLIELIGGILTEEPPFKLGSVKYRSERAFARMIDTHQNKCFSGWKIKIELLAFRKDETVLSEGEDLWQAYLDRENKAETCSAD